MHYNQDVSGDNNLEAVCTVWRDRKHNCSSSSMLMLLQLSMFFLLCVSSLFMAWGLRSLWQFKKLDFRKLSAEERRDFAAFERTDFQTVTVGKTLIGVVFLLPWRLCLFGLLIGGFALYIQLLKCLAPQQCEHSGDGDDDRLHQRRIRNCASRMARTLLYLFGVVRIREYGLRKRGEAAGIEDPLCVLSNHVSNLDILYFVWRLAPSFVAKKSIGENALLGYVGTALKCLFVDRNTADGRRRGYQAIRERQKRLQAGEPFPPLVIFAEGTTSNGRSLLRFKKGAFVSFTKIHPVVLIYRCSFFSAAYELTPTSWWLPLMLSSIGTVRLDAHWLPTIAPPPPLPPIPIPPPPPSTLSSMSRCGSAASQVLIDDTNQSFDVAEKKQLQGYCPRAKQRLDLFVQKVHRQMEATLRQFHDNFLSKNGDESDAPLVMSWPRGGKRRPSSSYELVDSFAGKVKCFQKLLGAEATSYL